MNNPNLPALRDKAARLPLEPGVYTVKISPVSFFGKVGKPISVKLKMGDAIPVPYNPVYQGWEAYPII